MKNSNEQEFGCIEKKAIEHATVPGPWAWDVRVNQLSSGPFHSKVQYIKSSDFMIYEQQYHRRVEARGTTSQYCAMVGTSLVWRGGKFIWCGSEVNNRRFACAAPGSEIDFQTPNHSHHVVMQVKPEVLVSALGRDAASQLLGSKHLDFKAVDGQRLIAAMTGVIHAYANHSDLVKDSLGFRSHISRLLKILADGIAHANEKERAGAVHSPEKSVRKAIAYVENSIGPVTALELAGTSGVSQRTLEYAFRKVLDLTPGAYLRTHRLNAAHRELLQADPSVTTVTKISLKWGFNHCGSFSVVHLKHFDETPSHALHKVIY